MAQPQTCNQNGACSLEMFTPPYTSMLVSTAPAGDQLLGAQLCDAARAVVQLRGQHQPVVHLRQGDLLRAQGQVPQQVRGCLMLAQHTLGLCGLNMPVSAIAGVMHVHQATAEPDGTVKSARRSDGKLSPFEQSCRPAVFKATPKSTGGKAARKAKAPSALRDLWMQVSFTCGYRNVKYGFICFKCNLAL